MYQKYIKRALDIIFSLIFLIISIPFMIITGIALYLSLGECTYKEAVLREGANRKTYRMYKFRTKIRNTKGMPRSKRYTFTSRLIDSLKLNELPQLINILKGDMSFVGPRPFLVTDNLKKDEVSNKRYLVKPGVTGLAQISGARAITHKQKLEYDIIYYDNISFILDLKIIILTPIAVIKEFLNYLKNKKSI